MTTPDKVKGKEECDIPVESSAFFTYNKESQQIIGECETGSVVKVYKRAFT